MESLIDKVFAEYEQLKKERDYAIQKVEEYADIYRRLAASLNLDPSVLLSMRVVSCEKQKQLWSGKTVMHVTFEEN